MYIKRVCCYCQKYLGRKKVDKMPNPKFKITHGICAECGQRMKAEVASMQCANNQ